MNLVDTDITPLVPGDMFFVWDERYDDVYTVISCNVLHERSMTCKYLVLGRGRLFTQHGSLGKVRKVTCSTLTTEQSML